VSDAAGEAQRRERRATLRLALGAAAGVALAAAGLLSGADGEGLPAGAIAVIDGAVLAASDYERRATQLEGERRRPLSSSDRAQLLRRMIEEELLILHGVALGLPRSDRAVRAALAAALVDSVLADVASAAPDEAQLRAFYAEQGGYFARPARVRLQVIAFRGAAAAQRARRAHAALLAGEEHGAVAARLGDVDPAVPPDVLLPLSKLRDYLGPTLVDAALALQPGELAPPLQTGSVWHLVRCAEIEAGSAPPLEQIRPQVEAELRRRAGERALREYLDQLWARADIELAPGAPR
jgi:hypothetical protein